MKKLLFYTSLLLAPLAHATEPGPKLPPEVIAAMRELRTGFNGTDGYVAQYGDSITFSNAFWTVMDWSFPDTYLTVDDGLPKTPTGTQWKNVIKGTRDKGAAYANGGGWKVTDILGAVDGAITNQKPEAAIIMVGTNDIKTQEVPATYAANLATLVDKCLAARCIPILNTIPPQLNIETQMTRETQVEAINTIIRALAVEKNVPLVDFHAAILALRPGNTWQDTLISSDGIHPTGGSTQNFSDANLEVSGYALRNWLNFLAYRELYFEVITHTATAEEKMTVAESNPAKTYNLWTSATLETDDWEKVGEGKAGTGGDLSFFLLPRRSEPKRFYRIGAE